MGHTQKGRHQHSPPNHQFSNLHDGSVDLCKKTSAYGHAISEKYGWFWSDALGYGFRNRWNMLQLEPPRSPVELRSSMQMCCFRKSSDGKPALSCSLGLRFVPREITRFLFYLIITSCLTQMWSDQHKVGPLVGIQNRGHLPCKNSTRVCFHRYFKSFFMCIKINAIRLTKKLFLLIFKITVSHDVWVTNMLGFYWLEFIMLLNVTPKKRKGEEKEGRDDIRKACAEEFTSKKNKHPLWELL